MSTIHYIRAIRDKHTGIALVIAVFAAYLLFPASFEFPVTPVEASGPAWYSLDPSWKLALNNASKNHLCWGRDLVITYGPWAYLSTRVGWGESKYAFLLFDLFMCFNFIFLFYTSYVKSNFKLIVVLLIFSMVICLHAYYGSGTSLVLLAFLIFWIRRGLGKADVFSYSMQMILLVILFFTKFNTGLVSLIFFYAGLLYNFLYVKKSKVLFGSYGILPLAAILFFCLVLNVSPGAYVVGGMNMVSGYNDIMYLEQDFDEELISSLMLMLLVVILFSKKVLEDKSERVRSLLTGILVFCSGYILYKQSFVRRDLPHVLDFFRYLLLFILCSYSFYIDKNTKTSLLLLLLLILIPVYVMGFYNPYLFKLEGKIKKTNYLRGFRDFTDTSGLLLYTGNNKIPERIRQRIGKNTVDVYPWNIHVLVENRLNYRPRPVPQSYMAYTPYLEELNFSFYNSPHAPHYVFYEYLSIDDRYPLFDESMLNLSLLINYNCVDSFSSGNRLMLLLEKNSARTISFEKIREFNMSSHDKLRPQANKYYEVETSNSFKGKCRSFAEHAPKLQLLIKTSDGQQRTYRTSKELLKTGIFSQHFFGSTEDFRKALNKDSLDQAHEIEFYSFIPADSSLFKERVKVREYRITY